MREVKKFRGELNITHGAITINEIVARTKSSRYNTISLRSISP